MLEKIELSKLENQQKTESMAQEKKGPVVKRTLWGKILSYYKQIFGAIDGSPEEKQLKEKINKEIDFYEKEAIIDGVNFSRCQIHEIVDDYKNGKKVEFETFSPYLLDYNTSTGEVWEDKLTNVDAIGLAIGKVLREKFPKARMISLYDEYNNLKDSSDERGAPEGRKVKDEKTGKRDVVPVGPNLVFSEEVKKRFKHELEKLMMKRGLIRGSDKEGRDFLFVSESSKVNDAEELVRRLEAKGIIKHKNGEIIFDNENAENPEYKEIKLRKKDGDWLCAALDASSYLKFENLEITHLIVLPEQHFKEEQDQVWEILRALGIKSDRYHNIFYDENLKPGKAAEIIEKEFSKYF